MKQRTTLLIIWAVITVSVGLVFTLPSCAKKTKPKVVKIGLIEPLTGDLALYGKPVSQGAEFAIEQANNNSANKYKYKLIMEDCEGKPAKTVSALTKLKSMDGIKFNIGPGISSCMLAAAPVAERARILMMGTTCENSKISQSGDYIFRVYPSYQIHGKALAEFARNEWGLRKAAIIFVNNDFGIDISKEFKSTFEGLGGTVVIQEGYIEGEKDFRTSLTKIKTKEPEVLFLSSYIREMPTILIQARELGLQCKFVASSSFYDQKVLDLAGAATEGVAASTSLYDIDSNDSTVVKYVNGYETKYGKKPNYWSSYGYDAAAMLIAGIETVGPEPEKVKNYFYTMPPKSGVTGTLSFDERGDVITDIRIVIVKNGKFETVKIIKKRAEK